LCTFPVTGILYPAYCPYVFSVRRESRLIYGKCGIAQAKAIGKHGPDSLLLKPRIAMIILIVLIRSIPVNLRQILFFIREYKRKLSAGIHITHNNPGNDASAFLAGIEGHQDGRYTVGPIRHHYHVAANHNHSGVLVFRSCCLNQFHFVRMEAQSFPISAYGSGIVF